MTSRNVLVLGLISAIVASAQPPALKIVVLEGQGAIHNIRQARTKEPVVEVLDQAGNPVSGASVTFTVPDTGPSGSFLDESRSYSAVTDDKGRASGRGLHPNKLMGQYEVRVHAVYRGQTAQITIPQTNAEPAAAVKGGSSKKYLWLALIGAAAAGGAFAAMGKGSASTAQGSSVGGVTASGAVITPGSPSFGPPH